MDDEGRRAGAGWTVEGQGRTTLLDRWVVVRRDDGRILRLTFPIWLVDKVDMIDMIDKAVTAAPGYPPRTAY